MLLAAAASVGLGLAQSSEERCPPELHPQGCGFTVWLGDREGNPLPKGTVQWLRWELETRDIGPDLKPRVRRWQGEGETPEGGIPGSGLGTRLITPEFVAHYQAMREAAGITGQGLESPVGATPEAPPRSPPLAIESRLYRALRSSPSSRRGEPPDGSAARSLPTSEPAIEGRFADPEDRPRRRRGISTSSTLEAERQAVRKRRGGGG